jgi:hypothetical protein
MKGSPVRVRASALRKPRKNRGFLDGSASSAWLTCPPDGRQVQKKLRPGWTGRGRPPAGYFTKRLAEDWLPGVLHDARRDTLVGQVRTGAPFADAGAEWLRYVEVDRQRKPSTIEGDKAIVRAQPAVRTIDASSKR